jgi:hypothetical protein
MFRHEKRRDLMLMLRLWFVVAPAALGLASCASTQLFHQ